GSASNAAAGPALTTKRLDLLDHRRRRTIETARSRAAIAQSRLALFLIPANPLGSGTRTDFERGCSRVQSHPCSRSHFCQRLSTMPRKSGILMDVHSISRKDLIARHNQHLRFWSNGQPVERSQLVARKDETTAC